MVIVGIVLLFVIVILLKLWSYVLAVLIGLVGGFLLGRRSINYIGLREAEKTNGRKKNDSTQLKSKNREGFL